MSTAPLNFIKLDTTPESADLLKELSLEESGLLLKLLLYLALHPNGGRITGAGRWSERQWQLRVGIECRPEELEGVVLWEGDDLICPFYPVASEESTLQKRENAAAGGRKRKQNRKLLEAKSENAFSGASYRREEKRREDTPLTGCAEGSVCYESRQFVDKLATAHPVTQQMTVLPGDVVAAAGAAYRRTPGAVEHAELLRAYLADDLQEDRRRKPFFRPFSAVQFFDRIESVVLEAQRWAKETGYKRRRKPKDAPQDVERVECPQDGQNAATGHSDAISDEERDAIFAEMRELNEQTPFKTYR